MSPRIPAQVHEPLLFAHRGASADAPDNTLESFRLAVESGVNGLESDVWVTTDGVAVLVHDDTFGLRRRRVSRSQRAEVPEHVPALEDLFGALGCDYSLSLDIKDPAAVGPTVEALRHAGDIHGTDLVARSWLCHPNLETLVSWRAEWSDIKLVHSTRLDRLAEGPERHASVLYDQAVDAVNFRAPDWTGGLTTLYHRFDVLCFAWDAHLTRVAVELLDMGCDAIFSNHVDRLLEAREKVWG